MSVALLEILPNVLTLFPVPDRIRRVCVAHETLCDAVVSLVFVLLSFAQTRGLPDFSDLAEKQGASVVNISTTQVVRGQAQMMPFPFDEVLN